MDALAKANERIVELENNLQRAKSIAAEQAENSQLATVSSAVYESINLLLSSVKGDEDFMCELIKRYADPDMLKDMLSGKLFEDADELYCYMVDNDMTEDVLKRLRDDGDLQTSDDDVRSWVAENARYSGRDIMSMVLEYVDNDSALEEVWEGLSSSEQRNFLTEGLSSLSDSDFRQVVLLSGN